jgi:hypothetical protein
MILNIVRKKQVSSPFKLIAYFFDKDSHVILERPIDGKCVIIPDQDIHNFIKLKHIETGWMQIINDQYVSANNTHVKHVFPLFDEDYRFVNLKYRFLGQQNDQLLDIEAGKLGPLPDVFEVDHFKLEKNTSTFHNDQIDINIECRLPLYKLYNQITLSRDSNNPNNPNNPNYPQIINSNIFFIKVGYDLYNFPYGNTTSEGNMCFGYQDNIRSRSFKNLHLKQLIKVLTTNFNYDYEFNIKNTRKFHIGVSFDVKYIRNQIMENKVISIIDMLYFISQSSEDDIFDLIVDGKLFYKMPSIDASLKKMIINGAY